MIPTDDYPAKPMHMMAASKHRQLDPTIRSFLDRVEESSNDIRAIDLEKFVLCVPSAESYRQIETQETSCVNWRVIHPAGLVEARNAFIFYLCRNQQDGVDGWATHGMAALKMAQASQFSLVFAEIRQGADKKETLRAIRGVLETLHRQAAGFGLDTESWAMIADGDSSLAAIECLVVSANDPFPRPLSLVLLTPVVGAAIKDEMSYCLTCPTLTRFSADFNPSLEQLRLLPPSLIVLAGVDPFRAAGEAFAQRLVTADVETVAVCVLGAIHDFCWVAPLLGSPVTATAHSLVTNVLSAAFAMVRPT